MNNSPRRLNQRRTSSTAALVNSILLAGLSAQGQDAGTSTNAPVKLPEVLVQGEAEAEAAWTG